MSQQIMGEITPFFPCIKVILVVFSCLVSTKSALQNLDLDVSENRGNPQIIHFKRVFHYKPSILGYHYF